MNRKLVLPVLAFAIAVFGESVSAQTTTRVSVDSSGAEGNNSSESWWSVSTSADGRLVAFRSLASNLVPGDTNNTCDIFVHDRQLGTTQRVSVDSNGTQGNGPSSGASISADGRFVAFSSYASNLIPGGIYGAENVFVHDRLSGTTELVSVAMSGAQPNGDSIYPAISADGRFVEFMSYASNLVLADTNGFSDVFVRDRLNAATMRVSVASNGMQGNGSSQLGAISADGRFVTFTSHASNLVAVDINNVDDVFMHDCVLGTTERVCIAWNGSEGNGASGGAPAPISSTGRCVAFLSQASNLVPGDTNGFSDIFIRDRQLGTTQCVSVDSIGTQGNGWSFDSAISADGQVVAFTSLASNLVPSDTNGVLDVFVHDRQSGITERASVATGGAQGDLASGYCGVAIAADGRWVAFSSASSSLVSGDTNGTGDVFVRDRGPSDCNGNGIDDLIDIQNGTSADCNGNSVPDECDITTMDCDGNAQVDSCEIAANPSLDVDHNGTLDRCQGAGTAYCFGDGTGHACPCDPGQIGSIGHGCANSSGEGAILSATGVASVTGDDLQLHVASMPNPSSVLFFQGTLQQGSGQGSFNGDGLLCVNGPGGNLIRLGIHPGQPGSSSFGAGIGTDPLISVRGLIPAAGGTRYYQAWFRDSTAFCTSANFNFSNGLAIVWTP